eukprot:TRINITY_DN2948_c0_g1_i3.p1 TRINITY_DN2948_c0_g1~~TRINITY_DN2948_c0_g1_i3.p1  ORF type:complete len:145 (+),score=15.74 TRINITY_DN2948_c0_g1_i3:66-500(+)
MKSFLLIGLSCILVAYAAHAVPVRFEREPVKNTASSFKAMATRFTRDIFPLSYNSPVGTNLTCQETTGAAEPNDFCYNKYPAKVCWATGQTPNYTDAAGYTEQQYLIEKQEYDRLCSAPNYPKMVCPNDPSKAKPCPEMDEVCS